MATKASGSPTRAARKKASTTFRGMREVGVGTLSHLSLVTRRPALLASCRAAAGIVRPTSDLVGAGRPGDLGVVPGHACWLGERRRIQPCVEAAYSRRAIASTRRSRSDRRRRRGDESAEEVGQGPELVDERHGGRGVALVPDVVDVPAQEGFVLIRRPSLGLLAWAVDGFAQHCGRFALDGASSRPSLEPTAVAVTDGRFEVFDWGWRAGGVRPDRVDR